jgi:hypothetical protein
MLRNRDLCYSIGSLVRSPDLVFVSFPVIFGESSLSVESLQIRSSQSRVSVDGISALSRTGLLVIVVGLR